MDGGWTQQKAASPVKALNGTPSTKVDHAADLFVRRGFPQLTAIVIYAYNLM